MKKALYPFLVFCTSAVLAASPVAAPSIAAKELHITQISAVVETFRTALINKEKDKFLQLFIAGTIPWIGVIDGDDLVRIRKEQPGFKSPRANTGSTHVKFIEGIVASPIRQEEKFWNIKIDTDGNIATVNFDYSYHAGSIKTNWGKEAWQLVNTDAGWKINAVIYSIIVQPPPPRQEIILSAAKLAEFTGTFESMPGNPWTISIEGDRLAVQTGKNTFPLFAESANKFFEKSWGDTFEFVRDADGRVVHFIARAGEESSKWVRR